MPAQVHKELQEKITKMENEMKQMKETMETMKLNMEEEITRRVKEEITTVMVDVNQQMKILEKDSATK